MVHSLLEGLHRLRSVLLLSRLTGRRSSLLQLLLLLLLSLLSGHLLLLLLLLRLLLSQLLLLLLGLLLSELLILSVLVCCIRAGQLVLGVKWPTERELTLRPQADGELQLSHLLVGQALIASEVHDLLQERRLRVGLSSGGEEDVLKVADSRSLVGSELRREEMGDCECRRESRRGSAPSCGQQTAREPRRERTESLLIRLDRSLLLTRMLLLLLLSKLLLLLLLLQLLLTLLSEELSLLLLLVHSPSASLLPLPDLYPVQDHPLLDHLTGDLLTRSATVGLDILLKCRQLSRIQLSRETSSRLRSARPLSLRLLSWCYWSGWHLDRAVGRVRGSGSAPGHARLVAALPPR